MPLYIADYLADTAHLNAAEHGAYLLLIMHYWRTGGLPKDEQQLARIARMTRRQWLQSCDLMRSFFGADWRHKRIDQELAQAIEISKRRSASASEMHRRRRASAEHLHTHSQSHSESQEEKKERKKEEGATAPDSNGSGKYAFAGVVIKLSEKHLKNWRENFKHIDVPAQLTARDAWLSSARAGEEDRKNWFVSTAAFLANKNQEAKAELAVRAAAKPDPMWRDNL